MKIFLWLLTSLCTTIAVPSVAKEKAKAEELLPILQSLEAEAQEGVGLFHAKFNKKINFANLQFETHGTFLQLPLANTYVANPGSFTDSKSPYIDKVASFQVDGQNSAVRFFVNKPAEIITKHLKVDVLVDRLLISLDHQALEKELKSQEMAATAGEIVAKTKVEKNIEAPAKRIKKELRDSKAEKNSGLTSDFMKDKLNKVALFSLIFLVGMVFLASLKPLLRKRRLFKTWQAETVVNIKTLATHNLAPKQKLALIQVGKEQILLGVTPDNINLIKTITAPTAPVVNREAALLQQPKPTPTLAPKAAPVKKLAGASSATAEKPKARAEGRARKTVDSSADVKVSLSSQAYADQPNSTQAISDVTKLIREKLKNLPAI